ncbi:hypothetical protein EJB05_46357, partial [Eragrostis curvula]
MAWSSLTAGMLFLLLVTTAALTLKHSAAATDGAGNSGLARPDCTAMCGNISIPYPFGLADSPQGCFLEGFRVYCSEHVLYLADDKSLKVLEFNLSRGEVRVQKHIASRCDDETTHHLGNFWINRHNLFAVSTLNSFTAIGCATIGKIHGMNQNHQEYTSLCGSFCSRDSIQNRTNCTGMGCCQIPIPPNLRSMKFSFDIDDSVDIDYSAVRRFNPCSYAFVAEADWFKFNSSYITTREFRSQYGPDARGVPMVVDWAVGSGACSDVAKMKSSYACRDVHSKCIEASNGLGYRCICGEGYDGNPYLDEGCRDIDECVSPLTYPCYGVCNNTKGSYTCSCPQGTTGDPKKANCTEAPDPKQPEPKLAIDKELG